MRPVAPFLAGIVLLWLIAVALVWKGLVFFIGAPLGMGISALAWIGVLFAVVVLAVLSGRRWLVVTTVAVTLVLCTATYNWSAAAPAAYFQAHQPLYERAVRTTQVDDSYYGARLPFALRPLSANGRVAAQDGRLFFPQWLALRNDAGGYFWSPERSPEGADMFGLICQDPVDLGEGWWACGMDF